MKCDLHHRLSTGAFATSRTTIIYLHTLVFRTGSTKLPVLIFYYKRVLSFAAFLLLLLKKCFSIITLRVVHAITRENNVVG